MVEIDAVLNIALQKFRSLLGVTQDYVKDIFSACDVCHFLYLAVPPCTKNLEKPTKNSWMGIII
jgi:hypothetical protein